MNRYQIFWAGVGSCQKFGEKSFLNFIFDGSTKFQRLFLHKKIKIKIAKKFAGERMEEKFFHRDCSTHGVYVDLYWTYQLLSLVRFRELSFM